MKAIVVGGGIGGLAAAIALEQRGWEVEVLERAADLTEVGAGLSIMPNAMRALDCLGVGNQVRQQAMPDAQAGIQDSNGRWLSHSDTAELGRLGQWAMLHRAELLDILRTKAPAGALRPGIEVHGVGADATVTHSEGRSTGDLVVGADGVHSVTRQSLWKDTNPPRYAGYSAWRMIAGPAPVHEGVESWDRGVRFGYAPLPDGRVYCYATANAPEGSGGGLGELRRYFSGWHDPIPALLDTVTEDVVLHHDIYDLPDLRTYVSGRVALLGDAAHAMTPNLGQGACQALEDAVSLGVQMDGANVAEGLAAYDGSRRPRTQMIVRRSRRIGVVAQLSSPVIVALRNGAMRMMPRSSFARALAPIVNWTA